MPMNTTLDSRSPHSSRSVAPGAICRRFRRPIRFPGQPPLPVAQKVHAIPQPACDDMHPVLPLRVTISTTSKVVPSAALIRLAGFGRGRARDLRGDRQQLRDSASATCPRTAAVRSSSALVRDQAAVVLMRHCLARNAECQRLDGLDRPASSSRPDDEASRRRCGAKTHLFASGADLRATVGRSQWPPRTAASVAFPTARVAGRIATHVLYTHVRVDLVTTGRRESRWPQSSADIRPITSRLPGQQGRGHVTAVNPDNTIRPAPSHDLFGLIDGTIGMLAEPHATA